MEGATAAFVGALATGAAFTVLISECDVHCVSPRTRTTANAANT